MSDGASSGSVNLSTEEYHRRYADVQAQLVAALGAAYQLGEDTTYDPAGPVPAWANLPEQLREALEALGRSQGGSNALVVHRPGSWEAQHVLALAAGADY